MSSSIHVYNLEDNLQGPTMGYDGFFIGHVSLAVESDYSEDWGVTSYSFGWIYDGLLSIGLIPHCVEAMKCFLEAGKGKTIILSHECDADIPDLDYDNLNQFELPEDGFLDGIYTLACEESGETFACEYSELLKPLSKTTLTRDDMDHFLERILDTPDFFDCFHNPPPCIGPYEDLPRLIAFIKENRDKTVHVSIREEFA